MSSVQSAGSYGRRGGVKATALFLLWRSPVALVALGVPCIAVWLMLKPVPRVTLQPLAEPAAGQAATAANAANAKADEVVSLDFMKLNFEPAKDPIDPKTGQPHYAEQLPPAIKAYDGRTVRIRGYLLPVNLEGNEVREFLIMSNQMGCCYGAQPRFWEFIAAKAVGPAIPNLMDRPLTFEGKLKVADVFENGYWTQLYSMECTAVGK